MVMFRIFGRVVGVVFTVIALLYMLLSIALYTHEPGVSHRLLKCIIASLPFLFCVWLTSSGFRTDNTITQSDRSRRAVRALLCLLLVIVAAAALYMFWLR